MGEKTKISWTDSTWNMIRARNLITQKWGWHCEHVTEACRWCYAERLNMKGGSTGGTGLAYKPGHRADVEIVLNARALLLPLRWRRSRRIFPCSMTDLAADFVSDDMLEHIFAVMALASWHVFQPLTKRPERLHRFLTYEHTPARITAKMFSIAEAVGRPITIKSHPELYDAKGYATVPVKLPLPNACLGVSLSGQADAANFMPWLEATPAAVRFASCEPLLGMLNLTRWLKSGALGWVICGGESGPNARPMHPEAARFLRDQCAHQGVPFHFKQWGEWAPGMPGPSDVPGRFALHWPERAGDGWTFCDRSPRQMMRFGHDAAMTRLGTRNSGRSLDGKEHNGFPMMPLPALGSYPARGAQ